MERDLGGMERDCEVWRETDGQRGALMYAERL